MSTTTALLWGLAFGLGTALAAAAATYAGVWAERKVSARIQMRYGPQQAGPFGLLQLLADMLKLVLKEDVWPRQVDSSLFLRAPLIVFAPVALSMLVLPLAAGWAPLDASAGALYFLAVPSVSVLGILLAGWSSGNTLATIGGLRGAAQMISYEVPRTLSVLSVVVLAGSMRLVTIMDSWQWWWTLPLLLPAFLVYLISSIAEMNRGPFDIPEAESELVAGYFAEYTGMRWAIFMMAEYGSMLAAALFGAAVFLGGANGVTGVLGFVILLVKALVLAVVIIWVKWSFPRFRADQLMRVAWKVLTPIALVQLAVVGVVAAWL